MTTLKRLSEDDVRAVFESLHQGKHPPPHLQFQIVPVGPTPGLKLSPPPHEFEDGLYVLLRPEKAKKAKKPHPPIRVPEHLKHLVMENLPPVNCTWSLSGPQFPTPTPIQQRYCYPKGRIEYSSRKGGALWTIFDDHGQEDTEYRLLHVYVSPKRAANQGVDLSIEEQNKVRKAVVSPASSSPSAKAAAQHKRMRYGRIGSGQASTASPFRPSQQHHRSKYSKVGMQTNQHQQRQSVLAASTQTTATAGGGAPLSYATTTSMNGSTSPSLSPLSFDKQHHHQLHHQYTMSTAPSTPPPPPPFPEHYSNNSGDYYRPPFGTRHESNSHGDDGLGTPYYHYDYHQENSYGRGTDVNLMPPSSYERNSTTRSYDGLVSQNQQHHHTIPFRSRSSRHYDDHPPYHHPPHQSHHRHNSNPHLLRRPSFLDDPRADPFWDDNEGRGDPYHNFNNSKKNDVSAPLPGDERMSTNSGSDPASLLSWQPLSASTTDPSQLSQYQHHTRHEKVLPPNRQYNTTSSSDGSSPSMQTHNHNHRRHPSTSASMTDVILGITLDHPSSSSTSTSPTPSSYTDHNHHHHHNIHPTILDYVTTPLSQHGNTLTSTTTTTVQQTLMHQLDHWHNGLVKWVLSCPDHDQSSMVSIMIEWGRAFTSDPLRRPMPQQDDTNDHSNQRWILQQPHGVDTKKEEDHHHQQQHHTPAEIDDTKMTSTSKSSVLVPRKHGTALSPATSLETTTLDSHDDVMVGMEEDEAEDMVDGIIRSNNAKKDEAASSGRTHRGSAAGELRIDLLSTAEV